VHVVGFTIEVLRAVAAGMSHCAVTQDIQCKDMESPYRNFETNCKFDKIKLHIAQNVELYYVYVSSNYTR
jgi:hypothetical protein